VNQKKRLEALFDYDLSQKLDQISETILLMDTIEQLNKVKFP
ncbi:uncharacterized protein METZ01_LOCUS169578, partial [marine metagenome]